MNSWKKLIESAMVVSGESFDDLVHTTLSDKERGSGVSTDEQGCDLPACPNWEAPLCFFIANIEAL